MCQPNTLGAEEAGISQRFSGLAKYSKNFLLNCCCSNFQQISKENPFQTSFKTISRQITSPLRLLKNFNPGYLKMSPIKCQEEKLFCFKFSIFFLTNFQDISKFLIIRIFGEPQNFLEGQKSKSQNTFPQCQGFLKVKVFSFLSAKFLICVRPNLHWLWPIFFLIQSS